MHAEDNMQQTKTTARYTVHWWYGFKDLEIYKSEIQLWGCEWVYKMQTLFACYCYHVAILSQNNLDPICSKFNRTAYIVLKYKATQNVRKEISFI